MTAAKRAARFLCDAKVKIKIKPKQHANWDRGGGGSAFHSHAMQVQGEAPPSKTKQKQKTKNKKQKTKTITVGCELCLYHDGLYKQISTCTFHRHKATKLHAIDYWHWALCNCAYLDCHVVPLAVI
jgi:hypothetical protein